LADCATCPVYLGAPDSGCHGVGSPGGAALTRRAVEAAALPPHARVLDLACGSGEIVKTLIHEMGYYAVGVDLSAEFLRRALAGKPGLPLLQTSSDGLPLADRTQDAVLVACALALMGAGRVLAEVRRVLKEGGKLILTDVYSRNPGFEACAGLANTCCLSGAESREKITDRLRTSGFAVCYWEDRPEALMEWMGRMIFALGSTDAVYRHLSLAPVDNRTFSMSIRDARLSYYLLVAEKVIH
jgi:ubiquinone/menaquinone biosynthesis C-methylase UbiE